ncbi:MAG: PAS domain S-box protein [Candidatus Cloacimonetes bacterium]|nr:PAS domain S-box protein [Candidatus Cloacimonadota bacterium]
MFLLNKKKRKKKSEIDYSKFLDTVENMLVVIDNTGNILNKNKEFDKYFNEKIKKYFNNLYFYFEGTELELFKKHILTASESNLGSKIETRFISIDSKEYTVFWSVSFDAQTNLFYLTGKHKSDDDFVHEQLQLSEEKSRKQFKSMPFPTYTWKKTIDDFILVDFNDIVFQETEGKVQHLLGITASKLLVNNPEFIQDMERCFNLKQTIKKEVKYLLDYTGEYKFYDVSFAFIAPENVLVQMEEITIRKLMEIQIQDNEEKYRKLYNTGQDAIFLLNKEGQILEHNESALKMFGYTTEEFSKKTINEIIEMDHKNQKKDIISDVEEFILDFFSKSMIDGFVEISCVKKNNDIFPAEVHTQFTQIKNNNILLIFIRDISQRKQMEKALQDSENQLKISVNELKKYSDELEKANQELKTYTYIISHDLKAPLRALHNLVEWLEADYTDKFDEEGKNILHLLSNRVTRMHDLIESILRYSKIGKIDVVFEETDLNELLKSTLDLLLVPENIQIIIPDNLPTISTSGVYIQQVFQNLIGNSIKFCDKPNGIIEIGFEEQDTENKFWVKDNGAGIEIKYYDKIFQLFQTLQPRDEFESTGIGLSIVKKIVDTLKGNIWLESEIGVGTTFFILLPK